MIISAIDDSGWACPPLTLPAKANNPLINSQWHNFGWFAKSKQRKLNNNNEWTSIFYFRLWTAGFEGANYPPQDCGKRLVKHARTFLTAPDQSVFLGVSLIFRHSHGLIYSHIQKKTEHHFSYKQDTWGGQTPAASRLIPSLALDADIHWYKPDQTKTEPVVIIIYAEYKSRTHTHTHTPSLWQSCPSKPTGRWTRCVRAIHPSAIFKTCVHTHTPAITLCQKSPNCTTKPAFSALFFYSWSRNAHVHTRACPT